MLKVDMFIGRVGDELPRSEIARMLRKVADRVEDPTTSYYPLVDRHGNSAGAAKIITLQPKGDGR